MIIAAHELCEVARAFAEVVMSCGPGEIEEEHHEGRKTQRDPNESELLIEMPDEALEAAACLGPKNGGSFTIAMCTEQSECPF